MKFNSRRLPLIFAIYMIATILNPQGVKADILEDQMQKFDTILLQQEEETPQFTHDAIPENLQGGEPFVCTGGQNPKNMKYTEYLKAFNAGPCSPIMIIPGITASKLEAEVDCEDLKKNNPDLFKACGWSKCGSLEVGESPKSSYIVWIPSPTSDFKIFNALKGDDLKCYTTFVKLVVNEKNDVLTLDNPQGLKVRAFGAKGNKNSTNCGFDAIINLFPFLPSFLQGKASGFKNMHSQLMKMGYMEGLTAQAMPYDWRTFYQYNDLDKMFEKVLTRLFKITGKKVTILTHSMGGLVTWHNLLKMSQEDKDTMVDTWMPVAPAFLGSTKAAMNLLGLSTEHDILTALNEFGVKFNSSMLLEVIGGFISLFQLIPRPAWDNFKDEKWYKALLERMAADEANTPQDKKDQTDPIIGLFPPLSKDCNIGFDDNDDKKCRIGVTQMSNFGKMVDQDITFDNFGDILDKESYHKNAKRIYDMARDARFETLQNPGVEVAIIYSNHLTSRSQIFYDTRTLERTLNNEAAAPDRSSYESGDGTLLTTSCIFPGFKWADDFNNGLIGAKRVSFVEGCSAQNQKATLIEDLKEGEKKVNRYLGFKCSCKHSSFFGFKKKCTGESMRHSKMIGDSGFVDFVSRSLVTNVKSKGVHKEFAAFSENDWLHYVYNCSLFTED